MSFQQRLLTDVRHSLINMREVVLLFTLIGLTIGANVVNLDPSVDIQNGDFHLCHITN
jgi:hypothetical protein